MKLKAGMMADGLTMEDGMLGDRMKLDTEMVAIGWCERHALWAFDWRWKQKW